MGLDEAIKRCLKQAEENDNCADKCEAVYGEDNGIIEACRECAADHRQLAEWLTDYKELKTSIGAVKLELLKEAQAELEKRGNMLHDAIAELEEAKRLLKVAVDDIHELLCDKKNLDGNGQSCNICSHIEWCPCCKECTIREDLRNWRYADEALKLIGDENDAE